MHKLISEDDFIYKTEELMVYLYNSYRNNTDIEINFNLEGPCFYTNGLYSILDLFCSATHYPKSRISIHTGNMVESHNKYRIVKNIEYWYDLEAMKSMPSLNLGNVNPTPKYHFGHFVGRATWARLWIAAVLQSQHRDKTVQTFHSGLHTNYVVPRSDGVYDNIGLDKLNHMNCDCFEDVIALLRRTPIIINEKDMFTQHPFIKPSNDNYPIPHPANLNVLPYYQDFCVDIVCETRSLGNSFIVSEKTWRPIVAGKPFIIVGADNFLKNLKRLGFETFNNFWDEGYDDYEPKRRVKHAIALINDLSKKPITEMHRLLYRMRDILEHNQQVYQSLSHQKIQEIFNE